MFCQQVLVDLIHDLSQPLGNIETSAYCLERALDTASPRAQEHLRLIRHQVEQARVMLVAATAELARAVSIPVIASGGVAGVEDIRALKASGAPIAGVVIGRALYDGRIDPTEALAIASE